MLTKVSFLKWLQGNGKVSRHSIRFPSAARRMDTLHDLLAASDLISLHCALTNETVQIINADCLQHLKPGNFCSGYVSEVVPCCPDHPFLLSWGMTCWAFHAGAFLVNTGSSQLLDDCAVKQLLIEGGLAGCALDGAEGPQWMEAWVWWIVLGYDWMIGLYLDKQLLFCWISLMCLLVNDGGTEFSIFEVWTMLFRQKNCFFCARKTERPGNNWCCSEIHTPIGMDTHIGNYEESG